MSAITSSRPRRILVLALVPVLALGACDKVQMPAFLKKKPAEAGATGTTQTLVEREVESPEVFAVTESALWDGRPSLGGVWVAYPGVKDPERVIIRNLENDSFVLGALFRRERDNPGPKIQVSSDAAEALGLLAGQPTELSVTALRKKAVAPDEPAATDTEEEDVTAETLGPIAAAAAAIDEADAAAATPATPATSSSLDKPFVQVGIFSVEDNARGTATRFQGAGLTPTVKAQEARGKKFWRVLIGPASTSAERKSMLAKARELGFGDAYAVSN